MLLPPQSLHRDFRRPWMQMLTPPQSLHRDFCRPWMQVLLVHAVLASRFSRLQMQLHAPQQMLHSGPFFSFVLTAFLPCIPTFCRFVPVKWFGSEVSSGQIEVKLRLFTTNLLLPKDLVAMWAKRNESHSSIFASCICLPSQCQAGRPYRYICAGRAAPTPGRGADTAQLTTDTGPGPGIARIVIFAQSASAGARPGWPHR